MHLELTAGALYVPHMFLDLAERLHRPCAAVMLSPYWGPQACKLP